MRSFVFWHDSKKSNNSKYSDQTSAPPIDNDESSPIEIHVNLWKFETEYHFDFGFYIDCIDDIDNLFLYVPFHIDKNSIIDLGGKLVENNLVSSIFNDSYTTTEGRPKCLDVTYYNPHGQELPKKNSFCIYALNTSNQLDVQELDCGTKLTISLKDIPKQTSATYFRIRIVALIENLKMILSVPMKVNPFCELIKETEVIDFRLNDIRSCNEQVREFFYAHKPPNITKIHYLILRAAEDIILNYDKPLSSRILEQDLWMNYQEKVREGMIAYHVKEKADTSASKKIEKFSYLVRFQHTVHAPLSYLKFLCAYSLLTVIIGFITRLFIG